MKCSWIVCAAFLGLAATAQAKILRVPQDYTIIQSALNAAKNGDEVVLSPGTYVQGNTTFPPRSITLRSTFDGTNWDIVKNTVIKAPDNSSVLIIPTISASKIVIRGLTISHNPVTVHPGQSYSNQGMGSDGGGNVTIEYNIIENCTALAGSQGGAGVGAGITHVHGVIQNNIIRNCFADNGSAMSSCTGTIQNNIISFNPGYGGAVIGAQGLFANNTLYDNGYPGTEGGVESEGTVVNNIIWQTFNNRTECLGSIIKNNIIKGYSGPDPSNFSADPQLIDPINGDFHLKTISPCIDAGTSTPQVKADFAGVQRGLKSVNTPPGYRAKFDIGAFEFVPKPVAVWIPDGPPDFLHGGNVLTVAWQTDVGDAGTTVGLALYDNDHSVRDYGFFFSNTGAGTTQIELDHSLGSSDTYYLRVCSALNPSLNGATPEMTVFGVNPVRPQRWIGYQ